MVESTRINYCNGNNTPTISGVTLDCSNFIGGGSPCISNVSSTYVCSSDFQVVCDTNSGEWKTTGSCALNTSISFLKYPLCLYSKPLMDAARIFLALVSAVFNSRLLLKPNQCIRRIKSKTALTGSSKTHKVSDGHHERQGKTAILPV